MNEVAPVDSVDEQSAEALVFVPLEEFVAEREADAEPLVTSADGGAILTPDGTLVLYGTGGAGKTTIALDLVCSLARGDSWLGLVECARPLRALIVEAEGPRQPFREKLARKLDHHGADRLAGRVLLLRDPWADFTLALEGHRQELAEAVDGHDADLVVVGPVAAVGMVGGGTPDEIRAFERLLADVRRRARRPFAFLLIHHENRAGQISGAWERVPDTLVHVTGLGHGRTRLYFQKARWSSELHGTAAQLEWAEGETYTLAETRPEVTADTIAEQLLDAVRANPGLSWSKLRDLHDDDGQRLVKGTGEAVAKIRDHLLADGTLLNTATRPGRYALWHHDDPAAPRSALRTDSERRPSAPAADEADPDPFAVRPVRGERQSERNGTTEPQTHQDTR